ncbi:hypothetical protein IMZ48_34500 [Candidatus Bathyarchaeota archaeon]|nr:hypothetical protein [Candidatus Bathyarchaeota archaeon]
MILARLSEQNDVLAQQSEALKFTDGKAPARGLEHTSSSASVPVTPATDIFPSAGPSTRPASTSVNRADSGEEVLQLKMKLAETQAKLSRLEDRSDSQGFREMDPAQSQSHSQMPVLVHESIWANEESFSDTGDTLTTIPPNRAPSSVMFNGNLRAPIHGIGIPPPSSESSNGSSWFGPRNSFNQTFVDAGNPYHPADGYRSSGRLSPDSDMFPRPAAGRRGVQFNGRFASPGPINGSFGPGPYNQPIGQPIGGYDMVPTQHAGGASLVPGPQGMGMGVYPGYQPPATALSPHATEFTSGSGWKNEVCPQASRAHSLAMSFLTDCNRRSLLRVRPTCPRPSPSTTAAFLIAMSTATGSTSWTRLSATTISRRPSSSSRSSRLARPSKSTTSLKPSSPRPIL